MVLVIDSCATEQEQLEPLLGVASSVIQEQLSKTETFNIIRLISRGRVTTVDAA